MKYISFSVLLIFCILSLHSCGEDPKPKVEEKELPLTEVKDGIFYEYYPERKGIKIKGPQTEDGQRTGRWLFYSENGVEMSMTEFKDGKKNGFTFVRYPNGRMRYTGEYADDKEVGTWRFYKEDETLDKEVTY